MVERVVVLIRSHSEEVQATIHWRGGFESHHTVVRPVASYDQLRNFDCLKEHLIRWRREGYSAAQIATKLHTAGFRPARKKEAYTADQVQALLLRCGLRKEQLRGQQLRTERVVAARSGPCPRHQGHKGPRLGSTRVGERAEDARPADLDCAAPIVPSENGCSNSFLVQSAVGSSYRWSSPSRTRT